MLSAFAERTNLPLQQWRAEGNALGGLPESHPGVPASYIYTANRLCLLIDSLMEESA